MMLRKSAKCQGPAQCKPTRAVTCLVQAEPSVVLFFNNNSFPSLQFLRDKMLLKKH